MTGLLKNRLFIFTNMFTSLCLLSACTTTFTLPKPTDNMTDVYLLKYSTWGHHSLAFYQNGTLTEYTYGDWELFALNKRDAWTAWKNMTFFTQGALGKKSTQWKLNEPLCEKFKDCEIAIALNVPTEKVKALESQLHKAYQQQYLTQVYNDQEDVHFVKYPVPYWLFHNCNHELVDWLTLLDIKISGKVFYKPNFIEAIHPTPPIIP